MERKKRRVFHSSVGDFVLLFFLASTTYSSTVRANAITYKQWTFCSDFLQMRFRASDGACAFYDRLVRRILPKICIIKFPSFSSLPLPVSLLQNTGGAAGSLPVSPSRAEGADNFFSTICFHNLAHVSLLFFTFFCQRRMTSRTHSS